MTSTESYRLGVDIGGTFTDIVLMAEDGNIIIRKVPSTSDNYGKGITDSLDEIYRSEGLSGSQLTEVIHSCTVATNAILERSGGPCGLITTKGFRDILEIRRFRIPEMYNLRWEKPVPLVKRGLRFEVNERIDATGNILTPLDTEELIEIAERIVDTGIKSIAVSLINSHINPIHEHQIKEILSEKYPNIYFSLSCDLIPLIGEYERTSEAVVNSYLRPAVSNYLGQLTNSFRNIDIQAPLLLMRSDGGMMSFEIGGRKPIFIVESGPAAGVVGCAFLAKKFNTPNVVCLDMGGTTTKASLIEDYEINIAPDYEVGSGMSSANRLSSGAGYIIRASSIDIAEIGAGGGSELWVDPGGALHVGPKSAGAVPGPACYNKGGETPTLTDANLVLGYLNPDYLTGGTFRLKSSNAWDAINKASEFLEMDAVDVAYGAHMIAVANMMLAIRAITTERGRDPRDFTLYVYGGAGPMLMGAIAREMEIKKVIIVPNPGLFSSFGLLFAQVQHRSVENFDHYLDEKSIADVANDSLENLTNNVMAEIKAGGYTYSSVVIKKYAALRYAGQATELQIPIPWPTLKEKHISELTQMYHAEHFKTYTHQHVDEPVMFVNLSVTAQLSQQADLPMREEQAESHPEPLRSRKAYFGKEYGWINTPLLNERSVPKIAQKGPAIIELYDSTLVVPPYCNFVSGPSGTVLIDLET